MTRDGSTATVTLGDVLEEFDERLGDRPEPEILTLTEKRGFVSQLERFNKRLAVEDTADYKLVGLHDIAFNPYLLWAGAIAQNTIWNRAIISPVYPTFRVRPSHDPRFVNYILHSPGVQLLYERISFGSVPRRRRSSVADFLGLSIPQPPSLPEQHRIAAALDKADAIRRKRQQAIALTEDLLRSTFLEMFGDPLANPKGWPEEPLENLIASIEAGWSALGESRTRRAEEWGVLKVSAVSSGQFRRAEHKAVRSEQVKGRKLVIPRKGDLLFSRANTRELVAAVCLVEHDCEREFLPDKLWRISTRSGVATREYLRFLMGDPRFRSRLTRAATGTSGSMLNISKAKLLACIGPKPPIELQERFASAVWRAIGLRTTIVAAEQASCHLFSSISQRAFRGEL